MTRSLAFILALLWVAEVLAQDPYRPVGRLPVGDTILSLPSPQMPSQGTLEVKFTHRFNQSLDEGSFSDQLHSLFGLDTNADVVFAFSYTVRRDLQLSVARSNTNDTIEAAAKYMLFQQAPAVPLNVSLRGGVDWRTEKNLSDRHSLFAQAILSRRIGNRLEVFALPTFVTDAGRAVSGDTSVALFDHAFNVPLAAIYMIRPALGIVAELTPPNRDLPDGMESDAGWALGIKRAFGGHWFEILVTNSQASMADQYVTSTWQGSPLESGDLHLGFNIERRFGRR